MPGPGAGDGGGRGLRLAGLSRARSLARRPSGRLTAGDVGQCGVGGVGVVRAGGDHDGDGDDGGAALAGGGGCTGTPSTTGAGAGGGVTGSGDGPGAGAGGGRHPPTHHQAEDINSRCAQAISNDYLNIQQTHICSRRSATECSGSRVKAQP